MATIKTAQLNILESPSVTSLTTGTASTQSPLTRLYDRLIGRLFASTIAETITVHITQAISSIQAIDLLIIPAGHNLNGETCTLSYSDDDSVWTTAVTWTQADALIIEQSFTSASHRYWKFEITSPASAVEMTELFLTATVTWSRQPHRIVNNLEKKNNVKIMKTVSGGARFMTNGVPKRIREYSMKSFGQSQHDELITISENSAGAIPFYLADHDGTWIWGILDAPLNMSTYLTQLYNCNFNFIEVIS